LAYGSYSERALTLELGNPWAGVTVPENHRFVMKCVTIVNNTPTAAIGFVRIHGLLVVDDMVPAASSLVRTNLHVVAYERESIQAYMYITNGAITINGFLFRDEGPRVEFPPIALLDRLPAPLPADGQQAA